MFKVPRNFAEFYAQNPHWIRCIALRLLGRKYVDEDVEDLEQELLLFLMSPAKGVSDRIQTFDPSVYPDGINAKLFFAYLKQILTNRFRTLYTTGTHEPLESETMSIVVMGAKLETGQFSETLLPQSRTTSPETKMFVTGFRQFVAQRDPALLPVLDAIATCSSLNDAADYLGVPFAEVRNAHRKLKLLGRKYQRHK